MSDGEPGAPLVHILVAGRALCGRPGLPIEWDQGEVRTYLDHRGDSNCAECLKVAETCK